MNLLNSSRTIFISDSAWVALVDQSHEKHQSIQSVFSTLLDQKSKIITSSYVIDSVLEILKQKKLTNEAKAFLDVIERALLSNDLKVHWLNRKLRRKAIDLFLSDDFEILNRALNIELIKQKRVHSILTLNPSIYEKYSLPCYKLDD